MHAVRLLWHLPVLIYSLTGTISKCSKYADKSEKSKLDLMLGNRESLSTKQTVDGSCKANSLLQRIK